MTLPEHDEVRKVGPMGEKNVLAQVTLITSVDDDDQVEVGTSYLVTKGVEDGAEFSVMDSLVICSIHHLVQASANAFDCSYEDVLNRLYMIGADLELDPDDNDAPADA